MPHHRCFSCFLNWSHLELDTTSTSLSNLAVPCSLSWCTLHGAMLGSTVGTCYASAPGAFWKVFFVKENSNLEVDSRPALLGPRYAVWRSVHSLRFRLLELRHFEILTLFPRASRIWQPVAHCFSFASEEFFPVSDTGVVAGSPPR